jgi:hypothetical protein
MAAESDAYVTPDDRYLIWSDDEIAYEVEVPTRGVDRLPFHDEDHALHCARQYLSWGYEGTRVIRRTTRTEHIRLASLSEPSEDAR